MAQTLSYITPGAIPIRGNPSKWVVVVALAVILLSLILWPISNYFPAWTPPFLPYGDVALTFGSAHGVVGIFTYADWESSHYREFTVSYSVVICAAIIVAALATRAIVLRDKPN